VEGADALGLIAEVGIAIAGFVGIVVALRAQSGAIGAFDELRIGTLLGVSAVAVLLALLPFALHFGGLGSETTWALSSAAMLLLLGSLQVVMFRLGTQLNPDIRGPAPTARMVIGTATLGTATLLQIPNLAVMHQLWPFYAGLLIITAHSLYIFALILFAPSRSEVQA
jgi:hypothetical protein